VADEPDSTFVRGRPREVAIEGACPYCGEGGLVMRSLPLEIPYFGGALQTTVLCTACTYRYADLVLDKEGDPVRYEFRAEAAEDLSARVVRSASATIRVPELRVAIEPGPRADAFVSNVEGVLHRIRDVAASLTRSAENPAARRKAEVLLASIDRMIGGTEPFTVILEDPTGNSAILHDRATKRVLTAAQAKKLKRPVPEFTISR
jgi:zinc finger protein